MIPISFAGKREEPGDQLGAGGTRRVQRLEAPGTVKQRPSRIVEGHDSRSPSSVDDPTVSAIALPYTRRKRHEYETKVLVWDASVDRHIDVAIDIDLIVLKIWRISNCGEGQTPKGCGHFRDSAGLSTLARHTRERDPNNVR
jgi:hypothetical protein